MKKCFIIVLIMILPGCTKSLLQNYQGSSDARYCIDGKYESEKFEEKENVRCIKNGEKWELWLEDLKINQLFEGKVEKALDNNLLNELAVFISIKKRETGNDSFTTIIEDKMLTYKDGVGINIPPNEDDAVNMMAVT